MLHREFRPEFTFSSITEAVARMIDESNLTMKQIAARTGKTYSTLSRELNVIDDGAKLGADIVLPLTIAATSNGGDATPYPLLFLAANLGYRVTPVSVEPSSDDTRDEMLDDNNALRLFHDPGRRALGNERRGAEGDDVPRRHGCRQERESASARRRRRRVDADGERIPVAERGRGRRDVCV